MNDTCCSPTRGPSATPGQPPTHAPNPIQTPSVPLPGGPFLMGTDYDRAFPHDGEGPVRNVTLSPFEIDIYPVTNADFARFISATGYLTDSERFGWSFCFWMQLPPDRLDDLVEDTVAAAPWWCKVPGATWSTPEGPGSSITGRERHPVVHVSWRDAAAYAAWAGQSLPTEAQWEYAARAGPVQKLYPWGDDLTPAGQHLANLWQGDFPCINSADDGFTGTCPVDAFPPNAFGLYSITGNAWEWTADWFTTQHSPNPHDPTGPPAGEAKVMKGGSFLCHESYCNRYRVAARTSNTIDSAASNVGFRCVRNLHPVG